ncbi:MAG: N-acetylmuramoyl-L-alanine amidase [Verrucomicrobia bacterium]|nr:N-acetylmuramoyl-L-alanine amidase [Verrucomicrobiota bacterium]
MKIAIVVGHNAKAPGAYAPTPIGLSEYDFNNLVADEMIRLSKGTVMGRLGGARPLELFKVHRALSSSYSTEIDAAYDQVTRGGADASLELHFNAAHPGATGSETLSSGGPKSLSLSGHLQRAMVKALARPDRGIKVLGPTDRGGRSLHAARATAALVEPFFSTNSVDLVAAQRVGIKGFARMYLEGLSGYAGFEREALPTGREINARNGFGTMHLETESLGRQEFFARNHALLAMAVENINKIQEERAHGEFFVPLTLVDAFSLMNAEMGMKGGQVDPGFVHHERGIGLVPLPSNLVYWNGDDAPLDHSRLTTEQNITEFLLYLSAIKNKPVGRPFAWGEFYTDLFRDPSTTGDVPGQMHLLAAVVNGWFVPQLYASPPDFATIAAKTAQAHLDPEPILRELAAAGFRGGPGTGRDDLRARLAHLNAMIALADPSLALESVRPPEAKPVKPAAPPVEPPVTGGAPVVAEKFRTTVTGFAG